MCGSARRVHDRYLPVSQNTWQSPIGIKGGPRSANGNVVLVPTLPVSGECRVTLLSQVKAPKMERRPQEPWYGYGCMHVSSTCLSSTPSSGTSAARTSRHSDTGLKARDWAAAVPAMHPQPARIPRPDLYRGGSHHRQGRRQTAGTAPNVKAPLRAFEQMFPARKSTERKPTLPVSGPWSWKPD